MADRQALNATFFAFKKRERGGVLTMLTLAYLGLTILIGGAFFLLNAQGIIDYINWVTNLGASVEAAKPGDPTAMAAMTPPQSVMALGPMYLLFLFFIYVIFAAYEAGCLRWMVRGETGGILGLTFGADMWRVWFGYWVWFFLLIAFYIVAALVVGGVAVGVVASSGGASPDATTALVAFGGGLALILGLIYFAIRFAPAAATSIARKRFAFFDAWTVSKGRFWALFGAYFLLFVMFFVAYLVVAMGLGVAMGTMMASQVGQTGEPQSAEEAFRMFANPQYMIMLIAIGVIMTAASMILYVAMFGINARAALVALEEGKIKAEA
ncbi:MAG: hypothetical protein JNM59_07365 [Hyphomonadaceae bacterium]|nr:hypothetical protein [Hyphomonadaceae bacterium]